MFTHHLRSRPLVAAPPTRRRTAFRLHPPADPLATRTWIMDLAGGRRGGRKGNTRWDVTGLRKKRDGSGEKGPALMNNFTTEFRRGRMYCCSLACICTKPSFLLLSFSNLW